MADTSIRSAGKGPRLSVCIPTYNRASLISVAIDSVLNVAKDTDIEIVVCDNASTDETESVIRGFSGRDPRVRYFRNALNIGADRNIMRLIEHARGDYVWILGSDDAITQDALSSIFLELDSEPDLLMFEAVNCDINLQPNGVLQFLHCGRAEFDFANRGHILAYLDEATMHASLFGYLSSMIFKRSGWNRFPTNKSFLGMAYPQVSKAMDILVRGKGRFRYVNHPVAMNRRDNCSYAAEFGQAERYLIDFRMFRKVLEENFSPDLEVRNRFKAYVRRCYAQLISSGKRTGHPVFDRHLDFFAKDDTELPPKQWLLRPKVVRAKERLETAGLAQQVFSGQEMLHLGFRGSYQAPTYPINENAIGIELGYSGGYDGTYLPFDSDSIDTIWASYCLHKMKMPVEAIGDWFRVVKPGGFVVVSCSIVEFADNDGPAGLSLPDFLEWFDQPMRDTKCHLFHFRQTERVRKNLNGREAECSEVDFIIQKIASNPYSEQQRKTSAPVRSVNDALSDAMKHHQTGDVEKAQSFYQEALAIDAQNLPAKHMLAVISFQRGDLTKAESQLREVIALNDRVPEVHYNLGCVLKEQGRGEEARRHFQACLAIRPDFDKASVMLSAIEQTGA